jgi:hypothetical protein
MTDPASEGAPVPSFDHLEQHAAKTHGEIDDDEQFMTFVDYTLPDGQRFRRPLVSFRKDSPFAGDRGVIDTARGPLPERDLDKRLGKDEHPNATTFWVKCYLRGTKELVHESRHAMAKRTFEIGVQQAHF